MSLEGGQRGPSSRSARAAHAWGGETVELEVKSQCVIDEQRSKPDRRRLGGTGEHALCCCARFSGLLPSWREVMDRRRLASVALKVTI